MKIHCEGGMRGESRYFFRILKIKIYLHMNLHIYTQYHTYNMYSHINKCVICICIKHLKYIKI